MVKTVLSVAAGAGLALWYYDAAKRRANYMQQWRQGNREAWTIPPTSIHMMGSYVGLWKPTAPPPPPPAIKMGEVRTITYG